MKSLETRVPPPLVGIIAGIISWLVAGVFGPTTLPVAVRVVAAASLLIIGFLITGAAARTVSRAKTTLNPVKPETSTALVTSGIYQYSRNPMYVGMGTWVLAWAAWLGTPMALIGLPLFVLYMNEFQIKAEERALSGLFGEDFAAFRARVRRWL